MNSSTAINPDDTPTPSRLGWMLGFGFAQACNVLNAGYCEDSPLTNDETLRAEAIAVFLKHTGKMAIEDAIEFLKAAQKQQNPSKT